MRLVWYAAYGSNTDETRFRHYLDGCRRRVEPDVSRAHVIDLPLYFAGARTRRWGEGGVAFVDIAREDEPRTLARAWLLPVDVVAEIGAQENGLPLDRAVLDPGAGDHAAFPGGWYDTWAACGELDGVPVVTLATSRRREPRTPPGEAYVGVVAAGLRVTHAMTVEEVATYLATRTNLPVATLMEWQGEGAG